MGEAGTAPGGDAVAGAQHEVLGARVPGAVSPGVGRPGASTGGRSPAPVFLSLAIAAVLLWQLAAVAALLLYSGAPGCGSSPSRDCVRAVVVKDRSTKYTLSGMDAHNASMVRATLVVRTDDDKELVFSDKREDLPSVSVDSASLLRHSSFPDGAPVLLRRWHGEYVTVTLLEGFPYYILNQRVTTDRETANLVDWSPPTLAWTIGLLVPVQILLGLYALRPRVGRLRRKGNSALVVGWCAAVVAGLIIVFSGGLTTSTHTIGMLFST